MLRSSWTYAPLGQGIWLDCAKRGMRDERNCSPAISDGGGVSWALKIGDSPRILCPRLSPQPMLWSDPLGSESASCRDALTDWQTWLRVRSSTTHRNSMIQRAVGYGSGIIATMAR